MHFMKLAVALIVPLGVAYASLEPYESASQGVADINEFTGDVRDLTNTAQGWNGQWSDMVKIVKGMSSLQTRLAEINGRIKPMSNFTKEDETQYIGSISDLLDAWTDGVASVQQQSTLVNRIPRGPATLQGIMNPLYEEKNDFQNTLKGKASPEAWSIFAPRIEQSNAKYNGLMSSYVSS